MRSATFRATTTTLFALALLATGCGELALDSGEVLHAGESRCHSSQPLCLVMQNDGNLVLYEGSTPLWSAHTLVGGFIPGPAHAVMQGDGNLVVYASNGVPLWSSGTAGHPGSTLRLGDGNLHIWDQGNTIWARHRGYAFPGSLEDPNTDGPYTIGNQTSGMRFPIRDAPAYANSQVYNPGGSGGGGGSQCDASNYSYPWYDNFCETRSWSVPSCPGGTGHQGQDIRPSTCENNVHPVVATKGGQITSIGSYSVYLMGNDGVRYRFLHMNHGALDVFQGQNVARGQRLGEVSNNMGGTPTTIHLHFDMYVGGEYVSPYRDLVQSYEHLLAGNP